ncbi:MAG: ABC transporter ATP-binding protein [Verrucomicrobiota bacterium]
MITLKNVSRTYQSQGKEPVQALRDVSLEIEPNSFIAVTGPSGCGKSTMLHLLGSLDVPDSGEINVGNVALHAATEEEKVRYRREDTGIIFQFFNLLPTMDVRENAALPLLLQGVRTKDAHEKADRLLDLVGLTERAGHFPHELSGGEMQRTAIARALIHDPVLVLADEPTGNLDTRNADRVLDVFRKIHAEALTTLIVVTHSEDVAAIADRRIAMEDGRVV